jgi:GTP-binding protein EngB required for normal cell division
MVMSYLECRKNIASMFIAVDIRRGLGRLDEAMLELCEGFNIKANIMLTKSDKVSNSEKFKVKEKTKKLFRRLRKYIKYTNFLSKKWRRCR